MQDAVSAATQQLDAIDHRRDELLAAEKSIAALVTEATGAIAAAKTLRDAPPDPDSAAAVNDAIAALQRQLAVVAKPGRRDPAAQLDALVDASDKLDVAVAAAQNQQRRLDGARAAFGGAMVSAKSQIAAVTDYIDGHRGGVGADARTRLAEAQRQLMLAQNESDPVNALDIARRAQTDARDADALARYDAGDGLHAPYAQARSGSDPASSRVPGAGRRRRRHPRDRGRHHLADRLSGAARGRDPAVLGQPDQLDRAARQRSRVEPGIPPRAARARRDPAALDPGRGDRRRGGSPASARHPARSLRLDRSVPRRGGRHPAAAPAADHALAHRARSADRRRAGSRRRSSG